MRQVSTGGLKCWSDAGVTSYYSELLFLSLFGPRNSVRAAWAALMQRKDVVVGEDHRRLMKGADYHTVSTTISRQMLHTVIVHAAATHQYSVFNDTFLLIGPDPEKSFFDRLNRMCPVPFKEEWSPWLWEEGLKRNLIQQKASYGVPAYLVGTSDDWAGVVKSVLGSVS